MWYSRRNIHNAFVWELSPHRQRGHNLSIKTSDFKIHSQHFLWVTITPSANYWHQYALIILSTGAYLKKNVVRIGLSGLINFIYMKKSIMHTVFSRILTGWETYIQLWLHQPYWYSDQELYIVSCSVCTSLEYCCTACVTHVALIDHIHKKWVVNIVFLFIGNSQWCLYNTQSILIGCLTLSQK